MNQDELNLTVENAIQAKFRGNLLARGQARSMIWRNGELPPEAPAFSPELSYDLLTYGTSLLSIAMRLLENEGDRELARSAFEQSGAAIESLVTNGSSDSPDYGFHKILAASAFHLGKFSAQAFSLLSSSLEQDNLSPIERAIALLITRSFKDLEEMIVSWSFEGTASDENIQKLLSETIDSQSGDELDGGSFELVSEALTLSLTDCFFKGLGFFLTALETGDEHLLAQSIEELRKGYSASSELNLVPQWWCFRLAINLLQELWLSSFHKVLPMESIEPDSESWQSLRDLFIASLAKRARAEIELWPSQIDAAKRSVDTKV